MGIVASTERLHWCEFGGMVVRCGSAFPKGALEVQGKCEVGSA
jgi:hypothetical protein